MPFVTQPSTPPTYSDIIAPTGPCYFGHTTSSAVHCQSSGAKSGQPRWFRIPEDMQWGDVTSSDSLCQGCYHKYRKAASVQPHLANLAPPNKRPRILDPSLVSQLALDDVSSNPSQTSAASFPRAYVSSCGEVVVCSGRAGDHVILDGSMQSGLARASDDVFVAKPAPPRKRLRAMLPSPPLPLASGGLASAVRPTAPKRSKSSNRARFTPTPTPTTIKRQTKPPYPTELIYDTLAEHSTVDFYDAVPNVNIKKRRTKASQAGSSPNKRAFSILSHWLTSTTALPPPDGGAPCHHPQLPLAVVLPEAVPPSLPLLLNPNPPGLPLQSGNVDGIPTPWIYYQVRTQLLVRAISSCHWSWSLILLEIVMKRRL